MITIKKLEWAEPSKETNGCWIAKCEIGTYSVVNENGWYAVLEEHAWGVKGFEWISTDLSKDTRQTAFDAARADYAARILSAIEVTPSPRAQALEEAAQVAYRVCAETRHVTLGDKAAAAIRALSSQPVADGPERGKFYHKHWQLSKLLEARNGGLVDHSGGEAWRYEYTSKDENGVYDMLYRHNVNASVPARLPASPVASSTRPTGGSNHGE